MWRWACGCCNIKRLNIEGFRRLVGNLFGEKVCAYGTSVFSVRGVHGNGRPEFLGNQLSVLISWVCIGTIITCDWWWSFNRQWLWTTVIFKQIGPDRGTYVKVGNGSGINGVLSRSLLSHLPRWKRALLLGKYFQFTGTGVL